MKHILHIIWSILFDYNDGIFYKVLRKEMGLIYSIFMPVNVDLMHSRSSSYYIETSTDFKNTPVVIKTLLDIIKSLEISDEDIASAKTKMTLQKNYSRFFNLTSYNDYYKTFLLHNKPIIEKSQKYVLLQNITASDIQKTLKEFKNNILSKGLVFYYSKKNVNGKLQKILTSTKSCEYLVL